MKTEPTTLTITLTDERTKHSTLSNPSEGLRGLRTVAEVLPASRLGPIKPGRLTRCEDAGTPEGDE